MSRWKNNSAGPSNTKAYVLLLMALGSLLRLDLLWASSWIIDGDEAIVGLMAQRLVEGREQGIPVFYYGQHYMGSLEPLMLAVLFWITGENASSVLLKLVPLLWSIGLIPLVYLLGRRVAGPVCGLFAAAYIALPPAPLVIWSSMARGGFIEVVVMATAALLLTLRWSDSGRPLRVTAQLGLVLGLGWWTNNQIVYAMLPIGLWMLVDSWRSVAWPLMPLLRTFGVGVATFVIGGLPFWWYNITRDFVSFEMFGGAKDTKVLAQVTELFTVALPIIFGAKRFWHEADLFWGATALAWITFSAVVLSALAATQWKILRLRQPQDLILVYFVTTCAVFAFSSFGWLTSAPRYLLPLYPAIAVLIGAALVRGAISSQVLASILGICIIAFNLSSMYLGGRAIPGQPIVANGERVAQSHAEIIAWLRDRNISMIRTNYWIGYRLAFETNEAVRFLIFGEPETTRMPEYETAAEQMSSEQIPLVLVPSQVPAVATALTELGDRFEIANIGAYSVIWNRRSLLAGLREIAPISFVADASDRPQTAGLAFDGQGLTRWGSGRSQSPDLEFRVTFDAPRHLKGIALDWHNFAPDYPRGLEIVAYTQEGAQISREVPVLSAEGYRRMQPVSTKVGRLSLRTDVPNVSRIVLRQLGRDRKFDWSIAEMKLYE